MPKGKIDATFTMPGHGLKVGDTVVFQSETGEPLYGPNGPLIMPGQTLYVTRVVTGDEVELA